ncbi:inositol-tetrakisphosphate 1-kinase 6 [Typha angustifolia]|uniref:inositol-tetrakisphosphate 1-kinase 6 n=1 Tax=Typha angustifolia TaxID=59011 RepID=UPI003C2B9914
MAAVRILLDDSVLLSAEDNMNPCLRSDSETLLRWLRYSNLRVAFYHQEDISTQKAILLKKTAEVYSFDCISRHASHGTGSCNELLEWAKTGEICLHVTSRIDEMLSLNLQNDNWKIIFVGTDNGDEVDKEILFINKLEELLITICRFIKKEVCDTSVLMVGYVMKPSREEDFAKRGAFPASPTQNGLMFVPLTFKLPLSSQLEEVDVVLHKVTDEIICIDPNCSADFPKGISFSMGMCELVRFIEEHHDFCVIDSLNNIYPLLDRLQIQKILLGLQDVSFKGRCRLRAPCSLKVDNFHDPNLSKQLSEANLSFPIIVKPQVACGVADAHNMALVFKFEDFSKLSVPLPAVLQEYVDHGSTIFKFYVLGEKVFHAVRKSMPNANFLLSMTEIAGSAPISFNSLKTLPVATDDQLLIGHAQADKQPLDIDLVQDAAHCLQKRLGLTIFGFDVVIQEGSGDHVIVDLNYLPSFKEVPDSDAMPAFWDAIRRAYELFKLSGRQR